MGLLFCEYQTPNTGDYFVILKFSNINKYTLLALCIDLSKLLHIDPTTHNLINFMFEAERNIIKGKAWILKVSAF